MPRPLRHPTYKEIQNADVDVEMVDGEIEAARSSDALLDALLKHHPGYKPTEVALKKKIRQDG